MLSPTLGFLGSSHTLRCKMLEPAFDFVVCESYQCPLGVDNIASLSAFRRSARTWTGRIGVLQGRNRKPQRKRAKRVRTGEDFGRSLPLQCVPAGLPYVQVKGSQRNKQLINKGENGCDNSLK
jgi:hypothetical protein